MTSPKFDFEKYYKIDLLDSIRKIKERKSCEKYQNSKYNESNVPSWNKKKEEN